MTDETRDLGRELGHTKSIPEYIHFVICIGSAVLFGAMWQAELAYLPFLIVGAVLGMVELYVLAYRIPAFHSSLTIYENGLTMVVQGKSTVVAYDQLNRLEANFTHKKLNDQSWGTKVRIEFFLDERPKPFIYSTEFRLNNSGEKLVALALTKCSQAIQRRLLVELERDGAVHWRGNVSLTADGIMLTDSASASPLIPYREIADWKIVDNYLKIWKSGGALPCLMMDIDTPNFAALFSLFESLAAATHDLDPTCPLEPALAATH